MDSGAPPRSGWNDEKNTSHRPHRGFIRNEVYNRVAPCDQPQKHHTVRIKSA